MIRIAKKLLSFLMGFNSPSEESISGRASVYGPPYAERSGGCDTEAFKGWDSETKAAEASTSRQSFDQGRVAIERVGKTF